MSHYIRRTSKEGSEFCCHSLASPQMDFTGIPWTSSASSGTSSVAEDIENLQGTSLGLWIMLDQYDGCVHLNHQCLECGAFAYEGSYVLNLTMNANRYCDEIPLRQIVNNRFDLRSMFKSLDGVLMCSGMTRIGIPK